MRKILLDSNKNYYKANLHCHSTKSDGKMTVEEVKEIYKKNGYSVIAFTDHEHLLDNSHLNDDEFLTITSCELAIKEFPELSTLVKTDMKVAHLNLYAKDSKNLDTPCYNSVYDHYVTDEIKNQIVHTCGEYERVYSHEGVSEMIQIANEKGFLVAYNHPVWSLENATDYLGYKGIWALEIFNYASAKTGRFEYNINAYDDFLRSGQKIACIAGDDNHKESDCCGGWIMINADKLEYGAIMDALEKHNLYSTLGPEITELYIEDGKAYLTFEKGEYATISTCGRRAKKQDGVKSGGTNKVEFDILPTDGYIRFDVVDKEGKRANTCAYFLDDLK